MTARRSLEAIAFARRGGGLPDSPPPTAASESPGNFVSSALTPSARAGPRRPPLQGEERLSASPSPRARAGAARRRREAPRYTSPPHSPHAGTPRTPEPHPRRGRPSELRDRPGQPRLDPFLCLTPTPRVRMGPGGPASPRQSLLRGGHRHRRRLRARPLSPTHRAAPGLSPGPGPRTWAAFGPRVRPSPEAVTSPGVAAAAAAREDRPAIRFAAGGPMSVSAARSRSPAPSTQAVK